MHRTVCDISCSGTFQHACSCGADNIDELESELQSSGTSLEVITREYKGLACSRRLTCAPLQVFFGGAKLVRIVEPPPLPWQVLLLPAHLPCGRQSLMWHMRRRLQSWRSQSLGN